MNVCLEDTLSHSALSATPVLTCIPVSVVRSGSRAVRVFPDDVVLAVVRVGGSQEEGLSRQCQFRQIHFLQSVPA